MKLNLTNGIGYPSEEIRIPGGHVSTDSQPPSSASSSLHADEEDYAGEIWEELDTMLRAQELHFVAQDDMSTSPALGTPIPFNSPTAMPSLHDMPATPTHIQQWHPVISPTASDRPPPSLPHTTSPLQPPS
jgi:hypothetical protein